MIYTFYSYKGGVGRTMALANIAELFYQKGFRVLMVDCDLEAPGLERYFPSLDLNTVLQQHGMIDMLLQYKNQMENDNDPQKPFTPENPKNHVIDVYRTNKGKGKLYLLTAGKRTKNNFSNYVRSVQTFNWQEFYDAWEGELYFNWLREQFENIADIILIDSRTGVSEMGGVCTYHLADVIVMLCAPNQQNLSGTQAMAKNFTSPEVRKRRGERELFVLPVPTRLERAESDQLDDFRKQFLDVFSEFALNTKDIDIRQLWSIRIPYIPKYAYSERVAVREKERESANDISEAYERLFETLAQLLPVTVQQDNDISVHAVQEGSEHTVKLRNLVELRELLANLYPDTNSLKRIMYDSGLSLPKNSLNSTPDNNWHSILLEAQKSEKLNDLLEIVSREYGTNVLFQHAYQHYYNIESTAKLQIQNKQKLNWPLLWRTMQPLSTTQVDNWWRAVPLEYNPFGPEQAERDPDLPKRAVYPDVLHECLSSRRTTIVFGAAGSGKTACARLLAYSCIHPESGPPEAKSYPVLHTIPTNAENQEFDKGVIQMS